MSRRRAPRDRDRLDRRYHLLFVLAVTGFGIAIAAWPLFYLVLQSYVPEWPGAMCIQGVISIGQGSLGPARHLPGLVALLEFTKPLLVFVAGTWLVLHLAGRRRDATRAALPALLLFGCVSLVDGVAETTYLVTPKREYIAETCCGATAPTAGPTSRAMMIGMAPGSKHLHTEMFFLVGILAIAGASAALHSLRRNGHAGRWLTPAVATAVGSIPIGLVFLKTTAAPAFSGLPFHECVYCLFGSAPESLIGIGLFALGVFALGWAASIFWLMPADDGNRALTERLLRTARIGYAGALLMVTVRFVMP
ncbi:MAG: hypothetical protein V3T86_02855 [Planctomycetota bacterium]